jgi:hypothetical protein
MRIGRFLAAFVRIKRLFDAAFAAWKHGVIVRNNLLNMDFGQSSRSPSAETTSEHPAICRGLL